MVSQEAILELLHTINDPEMPISIVDLGIVENIRIERDPAGSTGEALVSIDLLPTFIGCPALHAIEAAVRQRVGALPGVAKVDVQFRFDPPWTVERISPVGREALRQFGVTVPGEAGASAPACPFCGSAAVELESSFGPTRCRMIYYCNACKSSFEHMKSIGGGVP
ncbi:MAG TPA: 1,2-phenylacetyl-CoA epoxidase subunit PaaD [Gemmataceae bacterium]|nr:1,2-phenylacetyl-CoA epoxidase subunit PaaD [Gemmataceae bacterium]